MVQAQEPGQEVQRLQEALQEAPQEAPQEHHHHHYRHHHPRKEPGAMAPTDHHLKEESEEDQLVVDEARHRREREEARAREAERDRALAGAVNQPQPTRVHTEVTFPGVSSTEACLLHQ